ncbi:MAG: PH domain-containing protein [Gemmatimonadota bacterium]|nr:PH domain-containing protein [Gemmatimonadota bacterium]
MNAFRRWILRFLRVPPDPYLPAGDAGSVRVFQAGRRFYQYRLLLWGLAQLGTLWGLTIGLLVLQTLPEEAPRALLWFGEALGVLAFLTQLPITYAILRLDYELRWYIVTDRSLRIREGIVSVKEKTMTFANIQHITVKQGPLQRLMGISDVEVRTAGGGGSEGKKGQQGGESMHEAYFRGVDNAEEIRDVIREGVRRHRDSGLGDPDEPAHTAVVEGGAAAPSSATQAAADMVREARALHEEVRRLRPRSGGALRGG